MTFQSESPGCSLQRVTFPLGNLSRNFLGPVMNTKLSSVLLFATIDNYAKEAD